MTDLNNNLIIFTVFVEQPQAAIHCFTEKWEALKPFDSEMLTNNYKKKIAISCATPIHPPGCIQPRLQELNPLLSRKKG